jgi:hypothetical protein
MLRLWAWVLGVIFPSSDALPGLDRPEVTTPALAQIRRDAPLLFWLGFVGSGLLFVVSPLITIGWPLPAPLLPRDACDRHAAAMAGHALYPMRLAMLMLKTVGGAIWGGDAEVRLRLGMPAYPTDPGTFQTGLVAARPAPEYGAPAFPQATGQTTRLEQRVAATDASTPPEASA